MAVDALTRARVRTQPNRARHRDALAVGSLVFLAVAARLGADASTRLAGAALTFVSLVAESLPFLLVGALISTLLSGRWATRVLVGAGRHPRLAAALAPLAGAALPLCDCGLLPIARRLRGSIGGRTVGSFLAGAPLTNPIVVVTTFLAFPGQPGMVLARVLCGVAIAMAVAGLLTSPPSACTTEHDHDYDHHDDEPARTPLAAVAGELRRTGPMLVAGAAAAAVIKAVIPVSALTSVTSQPLLGALALMAVAFVMSLCSQADAFVAAALPVGGLPRLAFLVLGPVLDLRLAVLYRHAFGGRWLVGYAAVVVPTALVATTACAVAGLL
jgi:uncharacterized membrane protein YraQ (UPF0718 family)